MFREAPPCAGVTSFVGFWMVGWRHHGAFSKPRALIFVVVVSFDQWFLRRGHRFLLFFVGFDHNHDDQFDFRGLEARRRTSEPRSNTTGFPPGGGCGVQRAPTGHDIRANKTELWANGFFVGFPQELFYPTVRDSWASEWKLGFTSFYMQSGPEISASMDAQIVRNHCKYWVFRDAPPFAGGA